MFPVTTIIFEKNTRGENIPVVKLSVDLMEIQQHQLKQYVPSIRPVNEQKFVQFAKRFNRGDRCFIALADGVPCHFTWIRMHGVMSISSADKSYSLDSDQAWIFDCRTNENYRGLSIYPYVISIISDELLKTGKTSIMIDATRDNSASVNGILMAGFSPVKKIWRWGRIKWSTNLK